MDWNLRIGPERTSGALVAVVARFTRMTTKVAVFDLKPHKYMYNCMNIHTR